MLCDCGEQLQKSRDYIARENNGLIIYEPGQEGRGIGLVEKIRAYSLIQKENLNTYTANVRLGHREDERIFDGSADILKYYGIRKVNLLTSNPLKVESLATHGLLVQMVHQPILVKETEHNREYLECKRRRGHLSGRIEVLDE
jgi:3,4-dihydroxy 2-butanone 4-phosphate synthase / GTP cyclohydrolase II